MQRYRRLRDRQRASAASPGATPGSAASSCRARAPSRRAAAAAAAAGGGRRQRRRRRWPRAIAAVAALLRRGGRGLRRRPDRPRRAGVRSSRKVYDGRAELGWGETTTYGALARDARGRAGGGARRRAGDGAEPGAAARPLPPGARGRRQGRRLLRARRRGDQAPDAGPRGRRPRSAAAGAGGRSASDRPAPSSRGRRPTLRRGSAIGAVGRGQADGDHLAVGLRGPERLREAAADPPDRRPAPAGRHAGLGLCRRAERRCSTSCPGLATAVDRDRGAADRAAEGPGLPARRADGAGRGRAAEPRRRSGRGRLRAARGARGRGRGASTATSPRRSGSRPATWRGRSSSS